MTVSQKVEDRQAANRRPLIGGNWKMHKVSAEANAYCRALSAHPEPVAEVVLFPSHTLVAPVTRVLKESWVSVGGQDLHAAEQGAYTGDVSAAQLVDAGCQWVLCGHSERRRDHGETDEQVAAKVAAAQQAGLLPMVCVGETLQEREADATEAVLTRQVEATLAPRPRRFAIAYEPVWAIGTGRTATQEQAQEAHRLIRGLLADLYDEPTAASTRILYGGSATPDTAPGLVQSHDIDGFLVGGASLDPDSFLAIIACCG